MPSSPLEAVISNNICQRNNEAFQIFRLQIQFRKGEERVSLKIHFRSFLVQSIVLTSLQYGTWKEIKVFTDILPIFPQHERINLMM